MPGIQSRRRWGCALLASAAAAWTLAGADFTERPFAPPSGPRGETLFTALPPAETGIVAENRYADPEMWAQRYQEFNGGAIGTGVAIGDYDGDGRPDVFVVSKVETCRLFRNLGGMRFQDVTELAGVGDTSGTWKHGATFADIDNDGRLDLYVCRSGAPNLLFMNRGDGTFQEEAAVRGLAGVPGSAMAAFADCDRDGWLDLYLLTNVADAVARPDGEPDRMYRNNGDGTFADVTAHAGIRGAAKGHSATWWDYDEDGWPDLYVANDFAPRDALYHNNGDGTFSDRLDAVLPHCPFSSMGADLGDVNNDGHIDLLVADMAATSLEKDRRGMADSRARARDPARGEIPQYQRNALFLATGTGTCLEAAALAGLAATDWTWSVRFEDLDNDGWLDLHVTTGMNREQHNSDLLARMMAAEHPLARVQALRHSPVFAERNLAFRNVGDLAFEPVGEAWGLDQAGVSFGAAFGDLDGDGDLDLIYVNYRTGPTVLRNDSDSGHRLIVDLRGKASNRFGVGAVVELEIASGVQVRPLVLARGYASSSDPSVHFGLGDATEVARLVIRWPSGREQTLAHLPADRRITVVEPESGDAAPRRPTDAGAAFREVTDALGLAVRSEEEPSDASLPQPLQPFRLHRRGPALAAGDLAGDERPEIVIGGTTRTPLRIAERAADGSFRIREVATHHGGAVVDGPVLIFDANGDGADDLLVARGGANWPDGSPLYRAILLLNDGRGGFGEAPADMLPPLAISAGAAVAADFDHDGRLDLFVGGRVAPGRYPQAPRSALLLSRDGRFEEVTRQIAAGLESVGMVTAALATDVDDDGWVDLLLTTEWGAVRWWRNEEGVRWRDRAAEGGFAAAGHGWWTSLAAGDFNGDGKLDYVAGNAGLNTPYRADASHPALLFAGDFRGGGESQLIEAVPEAGRVYPRLTRRQLGVAIPALLRKFPHNDAFARASLEEVFSAESLAGAERLYAGELRTGVFLSGADGTHAFSPLPRLAQIAPAQGMVAADFDADGALDLYVAQNSSAPVPSIGRFAGGLGQLWRGDGRGGFIAVSLADSGLMVPGDAEAAVVADWNDDGFVDLLVSRNDDTPVAFQQVPSPGNAAVEIRLRGAAGNRHAIGARVRVEFEEGATRVFEMSAGSSYYSQGAAVIRLAHAGDRPPRRMRVRWPDGQVTEHAFVTGNATQVLAHP